MEPVEGILAEAPGSVAIYQAMYTLEIPADIVKIMGSKHHEVGGISRDEADISVLVYRVSGCRVTGLVGS